MLHDNGQFNLSDMDGKSQKCADKWRIVNETYLVICKHELLSFYDIPITTNS